MLRILLLGLHRQAKSRGPQIQEGAQSDTAAMESVKSPKPPFIILFSNTKDGITSVAFCPFILSLTILSHGNAAGPPLHIETTKESVEYKVAASHVERLRRRVSLTSSSCWGGILRSFRGVHRSFREAWKHSGHFLDYETGIMRHSVSSRHIISWQDPCLESFQKQDTICTRVSGHEDRDLRFAMKKCRCEEYGVLSSSRPLIPTPTGLVGLELTNLDLAFSKAKNDLIQSPSNQNLTLIVVKGGAGAYVQTCSEHSSEGYL